MPMAFLLLVVSAAGAHAFHAGAGALRAESARAAMRSQAPQLLAKEAHAPEERGQIDVWRGQTAADGWGTRRAVLREALRLGACGCAVCVVHTFQKVKKKSDLYQ
jgi:ATP:corrinoid adenosyltransferase